MYAGGCGDEAHTASRFLSLALLLLMIFLPLGVLIRTIKPWVRFLLLRFG